MFVGENCILFSMWLNVM